MRKTLLVVCLAAVSGLAMAKTENCTASHSLAYCLLDLAGLSAGAVEVSAADLEKNLTPASDGVASTKAPDHAINALFVATAKNGLELGLTSGIAILSLLAQRTPEGSQPQLFIMLPESKVQNGNPLRTAESALMTAVMSTLEIDTAEPREVEKKPTFGSPYIYRDYVLKGGQCGDAGCAAEARFFTTLPNPVVVIDHPPSWAGNERLYVWSNPAKGVWPMVLRPGEKRSLIHNGTIIEPDEEAACVVLLLRPRQDACDCYGREGLFLGSLSKL